MGGADQSRWRHREVIQKHVQPFRRLVKKLKLQENRVVASEN